MKKEDCLTAYAAFIPWVQGLKEVSDDLWHSPLGEGKWSTAALVSHIIAWDRFFLIDRLPGMAQADTSSFQNADEQEVNRLAAEYAASGVTKEALIDEAIEVRSTLLSALDALSKETLNHKFVMGKHQLSIAEYVMYMVEHDNHHQAQVDAFLPSRI